MSIESNFFRHKHLFVFNYFWDETNFNKTNIQFLKKAHLSNDYLKNKKKIFRNLKDNTNNKENANKDGILSWEDFELLSEKFTKLQRKGKLEKEPLERWKKIFKQWWNKLTSHSDYNLDSFVEFDEWIKFFEQLSQSCKTVDDLPDFIKSYLHLFFLSLDVNKDGLICVKDYKKYLVSYSMDISNADENFKSMLTEQDVYDNLPALNADRYKQLVFHFLTSKDAESNAKYIFGPFDLIKAEELEKNIKKII